MPFRLDDYIDRDVAYLAGLILARGTLELSPQRRLIVQFPHSSLEASGLESTFDQEQSIKLGLTDIRERLAELLDTDIQIIPHAHSVELLITFIRNNMIWRNIQLLTDGGTSFPHIKVPNVLFDPELPRDCKIEFVKGYGDAAGNVRKSNVYADGRYRVRLDVLNYPTNWDEPVQLCRLLQEHIEVPVQLITWGHPNLGRGFREHQLNIFADAYERIGFTFDHKSIILTELAQANRKHHPSIEPRPCPGLRELRAKKPVHPDEWARDKLDPRLAGKHVDGYWQICKKLGCERMPPDDGQTKLEFVDDTEPEAE